MGIAAQYLMQHCGFDVYDLVSLRLAGAGVMLLLFERFVAMHDIAAPFRRRQDLFDLLLYGIGMLGIQLTFFLSIQTSNAATAALTVTTGPLFVTAWTAYAEKRAVTKKEWLCLLLAVLGVTLIVTKGRFDTLDFSVEGVLWGIASAACGAFCTIQPKRILSHLRVETVVGWGMTVGGGLLCLLNPPDVFGADWTPTTLSLFLFIALVGTVGAFCCYLKSLAYIPAPFTALLANFEPLTAVVLGVRLLGLTLNAAEVFGIVAIFLMVFLLARK